MARSRRLKCVCGRRLEKPLRLGVWESRGLPLVCALFWTRRTSYGIVRNGVCLADMVKEVRECGKLPSDGGSYVVAPAARDDLVVIWRYYAQEASDPVLADRMVGEIVSGFHTIAKTPGIGHLRSDLSKEPLRFWAVRKYLINLPERNQAC